MLKYILAVTALLLMPLSAHAAAEKYEFDTVHTQILFNVNHMGLSNSWGKFVEFDGEVLFDQDAPEESSVNVTIQTNSLELNDAAWNKHVKSADFLNVEEYPTMTFKSTDIKATGDKTAVLTGDLTLNGVTKPVSLDVTFNKAGARPNNGQYAAGFSAMGAFNRSDFGVDYGVPMVADQVKLVLEVEIEKVESKEKAPLNEE